MIRYVKFKINSIHAHVQMIFAALKSILRKDVISYAFIKYHIDEIPKID